MHKLMAAAMLLALAVRAFVPQGFMPAGDGTVSLVICPDGFPLQLAGHAAHHHTGKTHWRTEHCLFGASCPSGPIPHPVPLTPTAIAELAPRARCPPAAIVVRLVHLPQPRGPPAAA